MLIWIGYIILGIIALSVIAAIFEPEADWTDKELKIIAAIRRLNRYEVSFRLLGSNGAVVSCNNYRVTKLLDEDGIKYNLYIDKQEIDSVSFDCKMKCYDILSDKATEYLAECLRV